MSCPACSCSSPDGGFGGGGADTIISLFVARHLMEQSGIRVSDAEARAALEQLPVLQTNGKFDISRAQMLEENAGAMGFEPGDLLGIMKDTIGLRKLQELVSKSYVASPLAAEKQYASAHHTFKGSKIVFETETFKKAATVTDDEIKKYYEENKDSYKTVEKRAVSYVFFENPKDLDKKPLEERQKAQNAQVERVNAFNKLTATGMKFAEAAKQTKEKVEVVPAFTQAEPPAALKTESELLNLIFARAKDSKTIPEAVEGTAAGTSLTSPPSRSPSSRISRREGQDQRNPQRPEGQRSPLQGRQRGPHRIERRLEGRQEDRRPRQGKEAHPRRAARHRHRQSAAGSAERFPHRPAGRENRRRTVSNAVDYDRAPCSSTSAPRSCASAPTPPPCAKARSIPSPARSA
jgi:hypothetical protein